MSKDVHEFDDVFEEITHDIPEEKSGEALSPDEVRKRAHGADSMRGRLEKEKKKARELEEKLNNKADQDEFGEEQQKPEKDASPAPQEGDQATGQYKEVSGPDSEGHPEGSPREPRAPAEGDQDQPKDGGREAIPEDVRKKAAEYELIIEQLRAQQERNRQLETMLSQRNMPGQAAPSPGPPFKRPAQPAAPQKPAPARTVKKVAIPEELKDDALEFQKDHPDFYHFLEEDSPMGKQMRNALRDYGPVQAALVAETRVLRDEIERTRREAEEKTSAITRSIQEETTRKHFSAVAEKHPEMAWRNTRDKHKDWTEFIGNVHKWIETLPYRDAKVAMQIAEKGDAEQVINLLNDYKAAAGSNQQGAAGQPGQGKKQTPAGKPGQTAKATPPVSNSGNQQARKDKEEMIRAAEAIASRPAPPRPPRPNPDDFDSAWDEAVGNKR